MRRFGLGVALVACAIATLPAAADDRVVLEPAAQVSALAQSGAWTIEARLSDRQLLSYVLAGQDETSDLRVEFWCQSAVEGAAIRLTGPISKSWWFGHEEVPFTYAVDGEPPKQVTAVMYGSGEVVLPRGEVGVDRFWRSVKGARGSVTVLVRDMRATVDLRGFARMEASWKRLCLK